MAVAAQPSCFQPLPQSPTTTLPTHLPQYPLFNLPLTAESGTFNYLHHGLTTTCTSSSALSPQSPTTVAPSTATLMNHPLNSLSDVNVHATMMNVLPSNIPVNALDYSSSIQQQFNPYYYPVQSVILPSSDEVEVVDKEHDDNAMLSIVEPSSDASKQSPMLRLDVNDMLTSWKDMFNVQECTTKEISTSPTSSSSSSSSVTSNAAGSTTTSPCMMDVFNESTSNQSGEELCSPKSVDAASNIRIQVQLPSNVHNINKNKIGKPEIVFKQKRKSVYVTSEDSKKIELINKSRFKEKKSRKRLKYPGESSLHVWKWMD